jgi:hypothetical protein
MKRARRPWTPPELSLLAQLYPHLHTADVAAFMGCTESRINNAAFKARLRKSDEYLASVTAGRIQRGHQHPNMIASRFKPGLSPWNKGTHFDSGGRSHETRFQTGSKPHTTLPVGSYRISADGALERKVSELSGAPHLRWHAVTRIVWEQANGPMPAGHIVVFKPGRRTVVLENITLDAVECISRAEHARRNHPRNKSPELAKLVQIKGAITRQVNRINREAQQATNP